MKTLTLWNDNSSLSPWRRLMELQRNWDPTLEQALEEEVVTLPACDLEETDSHWLMSVDLPGVAKKDISIEVKDDQLVITGERKSENKKRGFSERYYGKFQRALTLPSGVDPEKIEANYQDGVLTVAIAKAESVKPRQIKITEGKSSILGKLRGKQGNGEGRESRFPCSRGLSHGCI